MKGPPSWYEDLLDVCDKWNWPFAASEKKAARSHPWFGSVVTACRICMLGSPTKVTESIVACQRGNAQLFQYAKSPARTGIDDRPSARGTGEGNDIRQASKDRA